MSIFNNLNSRSSNIFFKVSLKLKNIKNIFIFYGYSNKKILQMEEKSYMGNG